MPAFAVETVDTTGAGDAFHAGYACALARGEPFPRALRFGAAVAALKCRAWGGRAGLPTLAETAAFLAQAPVHPLAPRWPPPWRAPENFRFSPDLSLVFRRVFA